MRIALVIPGFQSSDRDWCIPAFTNLARALAEQHEVVVFALRYPRRRDTYAVGRVQVRSFGGGAFGTIRAPAASLVRLWMDADRAIRQEHARRAFDAVVGIWATESGWVASRAGRRLGVPVLVHLAGGELTWLPAIRYGNLGRGLAWRLVRAALAKANIVTTPSGPMAGAFSATFPELASRGREWWPGVDTEMFRPSPEARPIGRPLTFVTVGSLVPVKGHRRVLEAFGRLSALEPSLDWRLIVAGDGPLRSDLEASARSLGLGERVEFRGDVPHDGLPDLLRACDCFVIGSFHEAECMAALEAMAAGLPWVAPPLGVFADLNSRSCGDRTGIAFGPESGAFVGALRSFALLSEPERAQMGEAARAAVSSDYEYRRQAERLVDLLGELTHPPEVATIAHSLP